MSFDTIIQNAQIVDGTGAEPHTADLGISEGKIAAVGNLDPAECGRRIDAAGRCLTPGFIDIHRHADAALFRPGFGEAELAQGLTTLINGNCGLSPAPIAPAGGDAAAYLRPVLGELPEQLRFPDFAAYFRAAEQAGLPLNCAELAGMGTIRVAAAGFSAGELTKEQEHTLHRLLERALADGVVGVSLGLGYAPECFYATDSLIRALAPLRQSGVRVTVHMRQEGDGVTEALREMLTVARALETPVEISHLKAIGKRNWRRAVPEMLELMAQAREEGVDVLCDAYPYPAGSTQLIHVLPPEFQEGGVEALTKALGDPDDRKAMRRRMETGTDFENITLLAGFENVHATSLRSPQYKPFEGKSIAEIAEVRSINPFDALFDLLKEERCGAGMIDFIADEADIDEILRSPLSAVISDATYPGEGLCHPRVYGAFPRLLERYVRERQVLTLREAVHKITGQCAERFGLTGKGRIAPGMDADLCLFSPERIHETGTYAEPTRLAEGMDMVFVAGEVAFAQGHMTDERRGRLLRHNQGGQTT